MRIVRIANRSRPFRSSPRRLATSPGSGARGACAVVVTAGSLLASRALAAAPCSGVPVVLRRPGRAPAFRVVPRVRIRPRGDARAGTRFPGSFDQPELPAAPGSSVGVGEAREPRRAVTIGEPPARSRDLSAQERCFRVVSTKRNHLRRVEVAAWKLARWAGCAGTGERRERARRSSTPSGRARGGRLVQSRRAKVVLHGRNYPESTFVRDLDPGPPLPGSARRSCSGPAAPWFRPRRSPCTPRPNAKR